MNASQYRAGLEGALREAGRLGSLVAIMPVPGLNRAFQDGWRLGLKLADLRLTSFISGEDPVRTGLLALAERHKGVDSAALSPVQPSSSGYRFAERPTLRCPS